MKLVYEYPFQCPSCGVRGGRIKRLWRIGWFMCKRCRCLVLGTARPAKEGETPHDGEVFLRMGGEENA